MKSHKEFYRYTIDNNIYKWNANNGHFIKLTGWVSGEDRRKYPSEIRQECLETLNSDVARELINKYWMSGIREWEHDGIRYNNDDTRKYGTASNRGIVRKLTIPNFNGSNSDQI